jgi:hypothetical protein
MFQKVILLDKGGRLVFFGAPSDACGISPKRNINTNSVLNWAHVHRVELPGRNSSLMYSRRRCAI